MTWLDRILQNWRIDKAGRYIAPHSVVLDVGSADGALFRRLHQVDGGIGIDPSIPEKQCNSGYTLYPGRFPRDLPARLASFDAVALLAVVEHLPETERARLGAACARYLKKAGRVIVTVPSPYADYILACWRRMRWIDGMSLEEHHGFDPSEMTELFPEPTYRLVHRQRFQLGLNNLYVFEKIG